MFFVYIIRISVSFPLLSWVYYINRYKISNFLRNDQIFCRKKEEINKKNRNPGKKAMKSLNILCFELCI